MSSTFYTAADETRLSGALGSNGSGEPGRSAFRKDYARLLHAPSFRRLQGKTQLFPGVESDFFRNRLTHSLEVAQIASGIATALNETEMPRVFPGCAIDCDLVEFAALAHDLGHPPFGHNGEKALDELMAEYGGFEGNAQTLRIVSVTERKLVRTESNALSTDYGLNLTYRSLASVLKYDRMIPACRKPGTSLKKGYYATEAELVHSIKEKVAPGFAGKKFKTIECAIMDVADDIAYSTYDLEDSLHAGFLTPYDLLHALNTNRAIAETVLRRTNDTLRANGYKPLK
ncbi:deoxyguanosinetriphosphate triphosphohydrolase family protein, partial [Ralstonia pseudosolanacearum]|uniref:deoxyguanosinetriphosphate triphosphohydrolase family protein n=1 Tax=Ralstonia pseudosolanacearum TaxID=1310165 RepID=UPI003AB0FB1C